MKATLQLLIMACLLTCIQAVQAQQASECGTTIAPQGFEYYRSIVNQAQAQKNAGFGESALPINIPVHFHIIRRNDGTGFNGLSIDDQLAECDAALDTVNQRYKAANLQFYRCLEPNIIMNDMFFDSINVGTAAQQTFIAANFNPSVINVYFTRRVLDAAGSNRCGWARFPTDAERWVIMNYGCLDDRNTFAHEMGHYFGLLHTHEDFMGAENVTRDPMNACFDCDVDGDFLCDTPADPTLQLANGSFIVNASCGYTGTGMDACGVAYSPDTRNIMSYTIGSCGNRFTADQLGVISQAYTNTRQAQLDNSVCNQTPCVEHVVLPNITVTTSKKVNAQKTITSAEIIMTPASEDVMYDAGEAIILVPGFHAKTGVRFLAFIDGCYIPPVAPLVIDERAETTAMAAVQAVAAIVIAPNPTAGSTRIEIRLSGNDAATVGIRNLQGQLIQSWQVSADNTDAFFNIQFDAALVPPGLYICTLETGNTRVVQKFVVNH